MKKLSVNDDLLLKLKEMRELLGGIEVEDSGESVSIMGCGHYCLVTCSWHCEYECAESCRQSGQSQHYCTYKFIPSPNPK